MDRGSWKSNTGFLLAAVGSAIGLGNIWRFAYVCQKNGGATFLIPYAIALLACGIPILILEFAIGHKMRASAPKAMHQINKEWEWLGWWPVLFVMFGINLYYTVVIAWCALFMVDSARAGLSSTGFPWAAGAETYFLEQFLGIGEGVGVLSPGAVQWPILGMAAAVWFVLWFICIRRIDKGVETACRIFMPVLLLLTAVLVVWSLTLEGAGAGIRSYLVPGPGDLQKLGDAQVWRDAFGQIFFSLSLGFGIMIAYASYLPKRSNLVRNAFLTAVINCGYSLFAGFAVFGVLGYMAHSQGTTVDEVVASGPGLAFIVYPKAISLLPAFASLFGFLFFLTLVLAGITSAMSIVEAFTSAVVDKFGTSRFVVVTLTCVAGLCGSVIFTTRGGLFWLDIVDHFLNQYGLIVVGLLECLLIVWYYSIDKLHFHLSDASEGGYPRAWDVWWEWSVKFVAPAVLGVILVWGLYDDIKTPYEGYPVPGLLLVGGGWVLATFLLSGLFSTYTKHSQEDVRAL